jgi:peptidoglycan DL-endopeptidase CwlO
MRSRLSTPAKIRIVGTALILIVTSMTIAFASGCSVETRPADSKPAAGISGNPTLEAAVEKARGSGANPTAKHVIELTLGYMGKPYKWGGNGPDAYDCSGLVKRVFEEVGVELPRVTYNQSVCGKQADRKYLKPGDLIFFNRNSHVGIYVNDGIIIHAYPRSVKADSIPHVEKLTGPVSACRRFF